MNPIEEAIVNLNERLRGFPYDFAFLGGSVLSLLVTDPGVDAIRVTKDIDIMAAVRSRKDFHAAERALEKLGFKHDLREGAPICRWVCDGTTVDVLPIQEDVLGWNSKWFPEALEAAVTVTRGDCTFKVVSAPYFVALKLEAFEQRGHGDFIASVDFEDVICLFNGRDTIVNEIKSMPELSNMLADKFKRYLCLDDLDTAVEGFTMTEDHPEDRKRRILDAFRAVADIGGRCKTQ